MILIETETGEEWDSSIDWAALAERAARSALQHSGHAGLADAPTTFELFVKFASDPEVGELNRDHRGKDEPTNVLSFPLLTAAELTQPPAWAELLLGDVILAHGVCAAEAADKQVPLEHHAAHLVVHGTLHLLGHDHETGIDAAEAMEALERRALADLGIPDPYCDEVKT